MASPAFEEFLPTPSGRNPLTRSDMEKPRSVFASIVLSSKFDLFITGVVLMSSATMSLQMQYDGFEIGYNMGYPGMEKNAESTWPNMMNVVIILEIFCGITFCLEVAA